MKSILRFAVFFLAFSVQAQHPSELALATSLMNHLGIPQGSTAFETNGWMEASSILLGTNVYPILHTPVTEKWGEGTILSDNAATSIGRYSIHSRRTEADTRLAWALRETCRSMPPDMYFGTYVLSETTNGVFFIHERLNSASLSGPTNTLSVSCLYSHFEVDVSVDTQEYNPEQIALALLRAGGVEIPDEPQSEP